MGSPWQSHLDYVDNKGTPPLTPTKRQQTPSLASGCLGRQVNPIKGMGPRVSCLTLTPSLHLSSWLDWAGPCICPSLALSFLICKMGQQLPTSQGGCGDSIRCSAGAGKGPTPTAAARGRCWPGPSTCSECPGRVGSSHQPTSGQIPYQGPRRIYSHNHTHLTNE